MANPADRDPRDRAHRRTEGGGVHPRAGARGARGRRGARRRGGARPGARVAQRSFAFVIVGIAVAPRRADRGGDRRGAAWALAGALDPRGADPRARRRPAPARARRDGRRPAAAAPRVFVGIGGGYERCVRRREPRRRDPRSRHARGSRGLRVARARRARGSQRRLADRGDPRARPPGRRRRARVLVEIADGIRSRADRNEIDELVLQAANVALGNTRSIVGIEPLLSQLFERPLRESAARLLDPDSRRTPLERRRRYDRERDAMVALAKLGPDAAAPIESLVSG